MCTECSVIRLNVIPLQGNVSADIFIKEDAKGGPVATVKIGMVEDQNFKDVLPIEDTKSDNDGSTNLIDQFLEAAGDIIPNFRKQIWFWCARFKLPTG
ncbi:jg7057 [Pararge aegeria aegeria]|uniref:Jg7057 protein n=1 Tax=Pararge aegeria aegeria TaxID=348720 RepID=A0A8S4RFH8_9NEOP|nr:jg7057 [Pararge aegeria aegeria]